MDGLFRCRGARKCPKNVLLNFLNVCNAYGPSRWGVINVPLPDMESAGGSARLRRVLVSVLFVGWRADRWHVVSWFRSGRATVPDDSCKVLHECVQRKSQSIGRDPPHQPPASNSRPQPGTPGTGCRGSHTYLPLVSHGFSMQRKSHNNQHCFSVINLPKLDVIRFRSSPRDGNNDVHFLFGISSAPTSSSSVAGFTM
jgi:hypothetical protein